MLFLFFDLETEEATTFELSSLPSRGVTALFLGPTVPGLPCAVLAMMPGPSAFEEPLLTPAFTAKH